MSVEDSIKATALPVQTELEADIVVFAGSLFPFDDFTLTGQIRDMHKAQNVVMMLTTFGGVAESAYRVARCLQEVYREGRFYLFIDSFCKSAGTIIALGADEIIMSESAELGPLDVQIQKPDEFEERTSGLTPMQALSTLRSEAFVTFDAFFVDLRRKRRIATRIAAEIAEKLTVGLFAPIYSQMEPMRLGENQRGMSVAEEYGKRLAKNTKNLRPKTLERLLTEYPSHDFIIDHSEATELFHSIRLPSESEQKLAKCVTPAAMEHVLHEDQRGAYTVMLPFEQLPAPDNSKVSENEHGHLPQGTDEGHGALAEDSQATLVHTATGATVGQPVNGETVTVG